MYQYRESITVYAGIEKVFAYIDEHARFSSHMSRSSWMMGGGRMKVSVDEGNGQKVGSHIRLTGKAFGLPIAVDEVITQYKPPIEKVWETVGNPNLIIIGHYRMSVLLKPINSKTLLRVQIKYEYPLKNNWLGQLFGGIYARWCVRQMVMGVTHYFAMNKPKDKRIMQK